MGGAGSGAEQAGHGVANPSPHGPAHGRVLALIAAGGALGGVARLGITTLVVARAGGFPWATFAINVSGSFLLALLVVATGASPRSHDLRAFVGVGFLGAFTTFSTFAVEVDRRVGHAHAGVAAGYSVASLAAGLTAAGLGMAAGRRLHHVTAEVALPIDPDDLGEEW